VLVASALHLLDQRLVTSIEGSQLPSPAQRFRVVGIAGLALGEDGPDRVELAVLPEQVVAAQHVRRQIPDPHSSMIQGEPVSFSCIEGVQEKETGNNQGTSTGTMTSVERALRCSRAATAAMRTAATTINAAPMIETAI
jgi:hypothetical protein